MLAALLFGGDIALTVSQFLKGVYHRFASEILFIKISEGRLFLRIEWILERLFIIACSK